VKVLSSAWTFSTKVVLPVVWISVIGLVTLQLSLDVVHGKANLPPAQMKFIFSGVWIFGAIFILWTSAGLKRVRIDSQQLYVSNYLREISIPFHEITDVTQNRWINVRPVTVYFREATVFGSKITFMPKRELLFWRKSPVVSELKELAGLQRS
jgi:hypothetical protein